jgi:hypothetical protein
MTTGAVVSCPWWMRHILDMARAGAAIIRVTAACMVMAIIPETFATMVAIISSTDSEADFSGAQRRSKIASPTTRSSRCSRGQPQAVNAMRTTFGADPTNAHAGKWLGRTDHGQIPIAFNYLAIL